MFPQYHPTMFNAFLRNLLAISVVGSLVISPCETTPSRASQIEPVILVVDTTVDSNDPAYQGCTVAPSDCSLRGAISVANADRTGQYTIYIPGGTYPISIPGTSEDQNNTGDLDLTGSVTLSGAEGGVYLLGNQLDRVLHVLPGANVTVMNIHISGGRSPDGENGSQPESGGGIYNRGRMTIQNSVIEDNRAGNGLPSGTGGSGGGIQNENYLKIEDSLVSDNEAGTGGAGHVCDWDYQTEFCFDCSHGGSGGVGGGIHNVGNLDIYNSSLNDNVAGSPGSPGVCIMYGTPIYTYGSEGFGGGIDNQETLTLIGSTLQENYGGDNGGGLSNQGHAYLADVTIIHNTADKGGGMSNQHYAEIENSRAINNVGDKGGGIYNGNNLHMLDDTMVGNSAYLGGGIYNEGEVNLAAGFVQGNWTWPGPDGMDEIGCIKTPCPATDGGSPHGGGIYNKGAMQLDQVAVSGNATGDGGKGGDGEYYLGGNGGNGGYGGGIFNDGTITLNNTLVISNTTGDGGAGGIPNGQDGTGGFGGGIYNSQVMTITQSQVTGNHTGTGTGRVGGGGGIANDGKLIYSYGSITDNQTDLAGDGGGIYNSSPLTITGVLVMNNTAGGRGGGIFAEGASLYGSNDIFARNSAGSEYRGSGLYLHTTTTNLIHTSLAQNTGGDGSGIDVVEADLWMTNTILVSHTIGISVSVGSQATLENTLWGEGSWANQEDWAGSGSITTGTQNDWLVPGFVDPLNLDYHLDPVSAAIDRGIHTAIATDIDNQPRPNPVTGIPDLGADEYWEFTPVSDVDITGPITGSLGTTIMFTATVAPETATPNILLYWIPPPDDGQWTNTASYRWTRPGTKTIEVSAINAGSMVTGTFTISIETVITQLSLPVIYR